MQKILPHELRARNVNGVEFLARADVQETRAEVLGSSGSLDRGDEDFLILSVGIENPRDDLGGVDVFVPRANALDRFLGLEPTARTAADVVVAEKRALSTGAKLQQLAHRSLR